MPLFDMVGSSSRSGLPRVRVIMPVYNGEKYIEDAIRSVLSQTMAEWELLIVDDGSTDSTVERVRNLRDPRVRLVRTAHRGPEAARLGSALPDCSTEFIAQFDADDRMLPDRLERQIAFLDANPEIVAVGGQIEYLSEDGKRKGFRSAWPLDHQSIVSLSCRLRNGICNPTITARTLAYRSLTTLVDGGPGEDLAATLQLASRGKIANLPDVVNLMRIHGDSVQSTADEDQRIKRSAYGVLFFKNQTTGAAIPDWHEFEADWDRRSVWAIISARRELMLARLARKGMWEWLNGSPLLWPPICFLLAGLLAPVRSLYRFIGIPLPV